MLKVPEIWLKQEGTKTDADDAVYKLFRNSKRIVAIIFSWQESTTLEGVYDVAYRHTYYRN